MSKTAIIMIIVAVYVAVMVIISIMSAKKAQTLTAFVVGGRKAGAWMSAFSYGTTYFSAVLFIGYAGKSGFQFGGWATLIGIANAVLGSYLAWKVLAEKTRKYTRRLKIKSMPQFFEKRYNSKILRLFTVAVIFIFMLPYSASVYSGLSYLCESVFNISYEFIMMLIAVIAGLYLIIGGYGATLIADFFQGIIMIGGMILMTLYVVNSNDVGGFSGLIENSKKFFETSSIFPTNGQMIINLLGLVFLTSVGTWGMPQMIHKFYGISDKKAIKKGTIVSTVFALIISGGSYFVGGLSRFFFDKEPSGGYDTIIPQMLTKTLPDVLLGIILVLVLSASISTLSGITLTSCSSVSMDFIGHLKKDMDRKNILIITRVLCFLFIAFSYAIAYFKIPIINLMAFSWGTISGGFLAPYMLGLHWKKMNKIGAYAGMIGGISINLVLSALKVFESPVCGVIAMAASFILCFIGTKIGESCGLNTKEEEKFFTEDLTLENN